MAKVLKSVPIVVVKERSKYGEQLTQKHGGGKNAKHVVAREQYHAAIIVTTDGSDRIRRN